MYPQQACPSAKNPAAASYGFQKSNPKLFNLSTTSSASLLETYLTCHTPVAMNFLGYSSPPSFCFFGPCCPHTLSSPGSSLTPGSLSGFVSSHPFPTYTHWVLACDPDCSLTQSSPRVARESWGLRSSHCRAEETSLRRVSGT